MAQFEARHLAKVHPFGIQGTSVFSELWLFLLSTATLSPSKLAEHMF